MLQAAKKSSESSDSSDDVAPEVGGETKAARDCKIYNTYNMGPSFGNKFPLPFIRFMVSKVLQEKLSNKSYNQQDALKWARDIADQINLKMKGLTVARYKHVVNVMLYQQTGAGCFYGARAIWDMLADDYLTYTFDGGSFVCVATVFGVYQY
ncbi:hypothetical protein KR018_004375 [Drosophila ironensis]|nr:hypothetical protein KR018_004375 [Drosophila ironensis]